MTTDGPLTTAEAKAALDCTHTQLYRWRKSGALTAVKERTAGRGRLLWDPEPIERLARALPPKRPGRTRQARTSLRRWDDIEGHTRANLPS